MIALFTMTDTGSYLLSQAFYFFDCLQYAKIVASSPGSLPMWQWWGESLWMRLQKHWEKAWQPYHVICGTAGITGSRYNVLFTILFTAMYREAR